MRISYNWLMQYIDIPYSPSELADRITMTGIEVEAIHTLGDIPDGVIVGEILAREPHPNADKLSICRVTDGKEELQIVCGAPNCDAGMKAPLATLGTVFIDSETGKNFQIKKTKLRGVESFGMLCSSRELGIDDEHTGIMELSREVIPGTSIKDIFKPDTVYEVEITPNRPDWLSHWGVARDIAAITGNKLKFPEISVPAPEISQSTPDNLVEIKDFELCPRYTARIIRNVKVQESPDWLKQRLISIDLRPINNIVDITNFVLHELGHPLHAFDLNLLSERRIVVRRAKDGETILTLDEKEHKLTSEYLVIADAEKPVALAGVMGGEATGVTEKTKDILLESAAFSAPNIRSTSRQLGISSDSSYRFERGIDFEMVKTASDRVTSLILEIAGGEVSSELVDVMSEPPVIPAVTCNFDNIRQLLGIDIGNNETVKILKDLGIDIKDVTETQCTAYPPSFRLDLEREADLAEEVIRIHGLDKVPNVPLTASAPASFKNDSYKDYENIREKLISLGLYECINYTLTDEKSATLNEMFSLEDIIQLANPISHDQAFLRPSLFADMLKIVGHNVSRSNIDLRLFEIGTVFCANKKLFPEERTECCIALTGRTHPERFGEESRKLYDFYDLKGILESWLDSQKLKDYVFISKDFPIFAPGRSAEILIDNSPVAIAGEVDQKFTRGLRLTAPVYVSIIQLEPLLALRDDKILFQPIPQYPAVSRDVAFTADESLEHQQVIEFIRKLKVKNLEDVRLFDIFRDEQAVGKNKKSMAYSLTFRNTARTLTDKEVNKAHEKLRQNLERELNVELR